MKQEGTIGEIKVIEVNLVAMGGLLVHDGTAPNKESTSALFFENDEPEAHSVTYEIQEDGREYYARFWYDYRNGSASIVFSCRWSRENGETRAQGLERAKDRVGKMFMKVVKYEGEKTTA